MLKHAAEEFRHAYYLKRQIVKVLPDQMVTYSSPLMLGGKTTVHYLKTLDLHICRYFKTEGLAWQRLKEAAYLFVTYAIEKRAEELYPIYEEILRNTHSQVYLKAIIFEEQTHLEEMKECMEKFPLGNIHAHYVCSLESHLCKQWLQAIAEEICQ